MKRRMTAKITLFSRFSLKEKNFVYFFPSDSHGMQDLQASDAIQIEAVFLVTQFSRRQPPLFLA